MKNSVTADILSIFKKNNTINNDEIKSILFLRKDDKIGDMIINTYVFREIKKKYPKIKIGVLAGKNSMHIIKNNSDVDEIFLFDKTINKSVKELLKIRKKKYDLAVDFDNHISNTNLLVLKIINSKMVLGFMKNKYKFYDISIEKNVTHEHITKRYQAFLEYMGVIGSIPKYYIEYIKRDTEHEFVRQERKVFLNLYGSSEDRTIKKTKAIEIIKELLNKFENIIIILSSPPQKTGEITGIINNVNSPRVKMLGSTKNIGELISGIYDIELIITPDTALIHIASAMNKRLVGLYINNGQSKLLWGPINTDFRIIESQDLDINTVSTEELCTATKELLEKNNDLNYNRSI